MSDLTKSQFACLREINGTFVTEKDVETSGNQRKTYKSLWSRQLIEWNLAGFLRLTAKGRNLLDQFSGKLN
jgi:hypothetical protein